MSGINVDCLIEISITQYYSSISKSIQIMELHT